MSAFGRQQRPLRVDYGCWRIDTEGPLAICLRPIREAKAFPASAQLHPAGRANYSRACSDASPFSFWATVTDWCRRTKGSWHSGLPGERKLLVGCAVDRCLKAREQIAAYALIVDAKDEAARRFYEHFGFRRLMDRDRTLYLPLGR